MLLSLASSLLFSSVASRASYPPGCGDATYPNDKVCEAKNWFLGWDAKDSCAPYGPYPVDGQQVYIKDAVNFCINLPDPNSPYLKATYYNKGLKPTILQAEGYVQSYCLGEMTPGAFPMPAGGIVSAHVTKGVSKNGKNYVQIYGQLNCDALGVNCVGTSAGAFDSSGQYDTSPFVNCGKEPYSGVDQSKNPGMPDYNMQGGDFIFCQRVCEAGQQLDDPCNVKSDTLGCFQTMSITSNQMYAAGFDVYDARTGVTTVMNAPTGSSNPAPAAPSSVSPNGQCSTNGMSCPSEIPCCSQYGWCGSSAAHCGGGCQTPFSFNKQCTGSSPATPATPAPPATPAAPATSGTPSPDGTCGPANRYSCTSGLPCCSQYGWCGSTSAHCGAGTQTAFAFGGSPSAASSSSTGMSGQVSTTSTDGQCGVNKGICPSATPCCSQYSWCGTSDAHCGVGKQADFSFGGIGAGTSPSTSTSSSTGNVISDWETCKAGDRCRSAGFSCCAAKVDVGPPIKYTCRQNDCFQFP